MKVSVLMPVKNNVMYLSASIKSVLKQSYSNFELLICDDGSDQDVSSVINDINDPQIVYIKNDQCIGVPKTLNRLIKISKGDVFVRQDSDDISHTLKFEKQIELIRQNNDFVITRAKKIDEYSSEIVNDQWLDEVNNVDEKTIKENIERNNYIVAGTAMWTKNVFDKIGFFDEKMKVAQCYNYWIRILKFFDVVIVDQPLYYHRVHNNSHRRFVNDQINYHQLAISRANTHTIIKG